MPTFLGVMIKGESGIFACERKRKEKKWDEDEKKKDAPKTQAHHPNLPSNGKPHTSPTFRVLARRDDARANEGDRLGDAGHQMMYKAVEVGRKVGKREREPI